MRYATTHRALALASLIFLAPHAAQAQAAAPAAPASAAAGTGDTEPVWETTRGAVRASTEWLARGVDSWFGDKPFEQGGSVTNGRASIGFLAREGEKTDFDLRFNARFRLPNVGERGYLFLGRDNRNEVVSDRPGTLTNRQRLVTESRNDQGFFAGLGLAVRDTFDLRLGFRGGLKPYAQARYRKSWALSDADVADFRQTFFWSSSDHLGSTTAFSFDHALSPRLAARWLQLLTITQVSKHFEWSGVLGLHRDMGARRTLALEALYAGREGSGVGLTDYGVRARWEQPLYKDWLNFELIVGHFWPRADDTVARGKAWAAGGGLKMKF